MSAEFIRRAVRDAIEGGDKPSELLQNVKDEIEYYQRQRLADALEEADWPSVADDVRDGVPPDVVSQRLLRITFVDGEDTSSATAIIDEHTKDWANTRGFST